MVTQHIVLDMTPGTKPIVNVSQYDTGARTLVFHLRQNRQTFTPPEGCTAIIHGIKPDSTYFSYAAEIDGDTVVADCTEQMTACVGFAECEVRLSNAEGHVGSANFLLNCEKSPMTGAVISESVIAAAEQLTDRAETAAAGATASATAAAESAEQAGTSATNAGESADRAAREAEIASQAAEEAGESAVAAANSASSASGSEASARGFAEQAEGFANEASESAQGAAQAAQTASAKASEAAQSAELASGEAGLAEGYARDTRLSAQSAQQNAQAAGESAINAAGSASTALQAAATATTKAGEASDSATAANTSAGQAASSASAANTSAENASASASAAATSAGNASDSASAAEGSASDASDSAAAALESERAAAQSAADIAASAAQIQINTDNIAALQIVESTEAADITSIDDGADGVPMKSLKVYIEPQQDLHGQSNPYPAGGGKNILPTPTQETQTINGVTVKSNADGSITFSGTASSATSINFVFFDLAAGDYILSNIGSNAASSGALTSIYVRDNTNGVTLKSFSLGNSVSNDAFTLTEAVNIRFYAVVQSGATVSGTLYQMIRRSGSGDNTFAPYSNICPISGWDSVETVRTGKNLLDPSLLKDQAAWNTFELTLKPNTTYTASTNKPGNDLYAYFNNTGASGGGSTTNLTSAHPVTVTSTADGKVWFSQRRASGTDSFQNYEWQIEEGSTATGYEPYQARTITTDLPSTVYGGVLDVISGVLTVDRAMVDLGTLNYGYRNDGTGIAPYFYGDVTPLGIKYEGAFTQIVYSAICSSYGAVSRSASFVDGTFCLDGAVSLQQVTQVQIKDYRYSDAASFKTAVAGQTLVYPLATPTTYNLTQEEVKTLLKANNVFANAGKTAIVYVADPKTYIDNSIADAVASLT